MLGCSPTAIRRRARPFGFGRREARRRPHRHERPARSSRYVAAGGVRSACRIRGRQRRRAAASRSQRCDGSSAGRRLMVVQPRRARRGGSRRAGSRPKDLSALGDLSGQWIDKVHRRRPPRGVVLDMDSSVSPTHGEQEMSVWNGHYECTYYHPLFVDLERCALRPDNVHTAGGC